MTQPTKIGRSSALVKFSNKDVSFSDGFYRITVDILGEEKKFLGQTPKMVLDIANHNFNTSLKRHNESWAKRNKP